LREQDLWADTTERAHSITRDRQNSLCLSIGLWERGQHRTYCWMSENSRALLESELYRGISSLLKPLLTPDPVEQPSTRRRRLPE
jgi:hypothetical protein